MDARVDMYGEDLYLEYTRAFAKDDLFLNYLDKYNINIVLLWNIKELTWAHKILMTSPQWQEALVNKSYRLFLHEK